jgi:hypothetical protein
MKQEHNNEGTTISNNQRHIVKPSIWSMTDGRSIGWTILNAIVPQHHDKAKGIAGGTYFYCPLRTPEYVTSLRQFPLQLFSYINPEVMNPYWGL